MINDICLDDPEILARGDIERYVASGRSGLTCIEMALNAAGKTRRQVTEILDLPCGHGRVLRHLKTAFQTAQTTARDLKRDGVDFCASQFGAIPVYARESPAENKLEPCRFDLIWVGSLLTHLDAPRWRDFLECFRRWLRPGGVLVFPTHGRETYRHLATGESPFDYGLRYWRQTILLRRYERTGFGYGDYRISPAMASHSRPYRGSFAYFNRSAIFAWSMSRKRVGTICKMSTGS
jgi:SAM-dependent methyltransferase